MSEYEENELVSKHYKSAEDGNKNSIFLLSDLARKDIENFDIKIAKLIGYTERWYNNDNDNLTKEEKKK